MQGTRWMGREVTLLDEQSSQVLDAMCALEKVGAAHQLELPAAWDPSSNSSTSPTSEQKRPHCFVLIEAKMLRTTGDTKKSSYCFCTLFGLF